MKLFLLLLITGVAFGQDSTTLSINKGLFFFKPTSYAVFDSSLVEIIRYYKDSDTVQLNPAKIHYISFEGIIYAITSAGMLQGKPWYMISPKLKAVSKN